MDKKTFMLTSGIMYVTLAIGAAVLWFNSHPGRWIALELYGVLVLLSLFINYSQWRFGRYSPWLLIAGLALALVIQYFDATSNVGFYFIVLTAMALFHQPLRFSAPFTAAAMLLSIVPLLYASGFDFAFWQSRSVYILPRLFMVAGIVVARYAIITSNKNSELAQRLRENSEKLEEALAQLQDSMDELKETADLRAREALMHELHDKLGHLLTTALIGAQAAEVLIDKDAQAAKERLGLAAEQIRQAMQALRHVITGGSLLDDKEQGLAHSLMRLISETETHAGVVIRCDLDERDAEALDALPANIRTFFYNALTEGLTNGIRHGEAKNFDFSLSQTPTGWSFELRDDGNGFSKLRPGVGLSKMRRDAARLGGTLHIDSGSGCTLSISLPDTVGEEALIEQN